jgi:hypothetical protein
MPIMKLAKFSSVSCNLLFLWSKFSPHRSLLKTSPLHNRLLDWRFNFLIHSQQHSKLQYILFLNSKGTKYYRPNCTNRSNLTCYEFFLPYSKHLNFDTTLQDLLFVLLLSVFLQSDIRLCQRSGSNDTVCESDHEIEQVGI